MVEIGSQEMKYKLGVPANRPLADFLPAVTIAAKNLATQITNFNIKKQDLLKAPARLKSTRENKRVLCFHLLLQMYFFCLLPSHIDRLIEQARYA